MEYWVQYFEKSFMPVSIFTESFCGFTSRKVVFAREEALRIANTDRARWHGNAVAFVYESHDQRLSSLALPPFRTRLSYGKPKLRRNAAQFLRFSKVQSCNFVVNLY